MASRRRRFRRIRIFFFALTGALVATIFFMLRELARKNRIEIALDFLRDMTRRNEAHKRKTGSFSTDHLALSATRHRSDLQKILRAELYWREEDLPERVRRVLPKSRVPYLAEDSFRTIMLFHAFERQILVQKEASVGPTILGIVDADGTLKPLRGYT